MTASASARAASVQSILDSLGALPAPTIEPLLVLTVGLPGSGKSTFARRLAPRIGAVILQSDVLRPLLFENVTYQPSESRLLFRAIHRAAFSLLKRGISVIIDATSVQESDRVPVYELADAARVRLVVVHLTAPLNVIEERLARRMTNRDPDDHSNADIGVYRLMASRSQPLVGEAIHIDTSDPAALDAAVEQIATEYTKVPATGRNGGRP